MEHALISARRVQGTELRNHRGEDLGTIEDLMIEKLSGKIVYAILSFGGILGLGSKHFALPWEALHYEPDMSAYVVNIDPEVLQRAPGFDPDNPPDMTDRRWGAQIHDYYGYRPYWERDEPASGGAGATGTMGGRT
jgi:hypothetical protein